MSTLFTPLTLRDPYFLLRAAHALGTEVTWPDQYARARL